VTEFVYFCDYILQKGIYHVKSSWTEKMLSNVKGYFKQHYEKKIKDIFRRSGLYDGHMIDIPHLVNSAELLIAPQFTAGDTVLTVGAALNEIIDEVAGVISIGPFGCMPCRVSEAILTEGINTEKPKIATDAKIVQHVLEKYPALPFLAIESDGNAFPQMIEAKLEIFCMQVDRIHKAIMEKKLERRKNA
jgi:predicted nucleotide-binding protein (sugar kinase/HSP70/actin superfamily)